jgi:hypothetical protein
LVTSVVPVAGVPWPGPRRSSTTASCSSPSPADRRPPGPRRAQPAIGHAAAGVRPPDGRIRLQLHRDRAVLDRPPRAVPPHQGPRPVPDPAEPALPRLHRLSALPDVPAQRGRRPGAGDVFYAVSIAAPVWPRPRSGCTPSTSASWPSLASHPWCTAGSCCGSSPARWCSCSRSRSPSPSPS